MQQPGTGSLSQVIHASWIFHHMCLCLTHSNSVIIFYYITLYWFQVNLQAFGIFSGKNEGCLGNFWSINGKCGDNLLSNHFFTGLHQFSTDYIRLLLHDKGPNRLFYLMHNHNYRQTLTSSGSILGKTVCSCTTTSAVLAFLIPVAGMWNVILCAFSPPVNTNHTSQITSDMKINFQCFSM